MVKFEVRVIYKNTEFYATLRITADRIEIHPFDEEIDPVAFSESYIDGYIPFNNTEVPYGLQLNFKSKKRSPLKMIFRNKRNLDRAEAAISTLFSTSLDYDANELKTEVENDNNSVESEIAPTPTLQEN